jgi:hypothetical protein
MFLFFDYFARNLNYQPAPLQDRAEERREASLGARRVQARLPQPKPGAGEGKWRSADASRAAPVE